MDAYRHLYGNGAAPVTIVEYGDFQCPFCRDAAPVLKQLVDSSGGGIRLVFRHFPLFTVHPFALTAALAAEAAGKHFWQLHDVLFEHQDRLTDADLAGYAESVGVRGVTGGAAQAFRPEVEGDYRAGVAAGVRGTPTLFLDGERYPGPIDLASLRQAAGS